MTDVEVTLLTQKSRLHGKGRSIHLAEGPLSEARGNTDREWRLRVAGGTDHTWKPTAGRITAPNSAAEYDG
jgi:hypothetical protein